MGDRVAMLVMDQGKALMVRQRYRGQTLWVLPGGSPHAGEPPGRTAVREVREETGLVTSAGELLGDRPRTGSSGRYKLVAGRLEGGQKRVGDDRDHHGQAELLETGWQNPDRLDVALERDLVMAVLKTHPEYAARR